jgi:type I restriction-modification system DNA methylase subunit
MNPPFRNQSDIDLVLHAYSMLARNGRLVAIMSGGVMFRNNAKTTAFRELVHSCGGTITENPPGSFKESGTSVNTVMVTMNKLA